MQPKPGEFCRVVLGDLTCLGAGYGEVADLLADLVLTAAELRVITPEQYKELYLLGDWNGEPNPFCRNLKGMIRSGELPYILWENECESQVFLEYGGHRAVLREYSRRLREHRTIHSILQHEFGDVQLDAARLPDGFQNRVAEACVPLVSELLNLMLDYNLRIKHKLISDFGYCEHGWTSPTTGSRARVILSSHNTRFQRIVGLPGWFEEVPSCKSVGSGVPDSFPDQLLRDLATATWLFPDVDVGVYALVCTPSSTNQLSLIDLRHVLLTTYKMLEYMWTARQTRLISREVYRTSDHLLVVFADRQTFEELAALIDKMEP